MQAEGVISRFDPVYWTVDFPRPMMAAVTDDRARYACGSMRCSIGTDDLAGLIWEAEDGYDHPLLRYATDRDFRACRLRFRWRSSGVTALDAVNGPTLTIEGRDAAGDPRTWYVRLWNYASGDPEDARGRDRLRERSTAGSCCRARPIRCARGISTGCSCRWCRAGYTGTDAAIWRRRPRGGSR